jgi:hypothetical protein
MNKNSTAILMATVLLTFSLAACKPSNDPPPDIIKTQREALQKARAVGDVQKKAADEQQKAADEQTKQADDSTK